MRMRSAAIPIVLGLLAGTAPGLASSTSVAGGSNGTTVVVNGQPCRVVTTHDGGSGSSAASTSVTAGSGSVAGAVTVSPGGGSGSSVSVGSSAGSSAGQTSSAAGSDCVIYRHEK
jgi:hypothetical protein